MNLYIFRPFKSGMVRLAVGLTAMIGIGWIQPVKAAKEPKSLITDERVKQVAYDPNQVYEILGTYGYQTSIEFGADESIKVVTLGDTIAWQTVPYQNRLFIKPVERNAATNLTVITDRYTYYFKLNSTNRANAETFLVRFIYPNANINIFSQLGNSKKGLTGFDPSKLNLDFSASGNKTAIALNRAFDDGQFTYLYFDSGSEIPSWTRPRITGPSVSAN